MCKKHTNFLFKKIIGLDRAFHVQFYNASFNQKYKAFDMRVCHLCCFYIVISYHLIQINDIYEEVIMFYCKYRCPYMSTERTAETLLYFSRTKGLPFRLVVDLMEYREVIFIRRGQSSCKANIFIVRRDVTSLIASSL